nr:PREDICTED: vacuolar protein sorting-associated protein 18 homolog isoform X1 [Bemisia tabaci]
MFITKTGLICNFHLGLDASVLVSLTCRLTDHSIKVAKMTSIFDQFEQTSQRNPSPSVMTRAPILPELSASDYVNIALQEEKPMFTKQKVNFLPTKRITHMAVCNELVVIVMANTTLLYKSLKDPDNPKEKDLTKDIMQARLGRIFLDVSGNHLLLSLLPRLPNGEHELLYFNLISSENKSPSRLQLKNTEVTAIAWCHKSRPNQLVNSGPILLGSSLGVIYEADLNASSDTFRNAYLAQSNFDRRELFDIGKGTTTVITSIEYHQLPSSDTYFVFVSTYSKFYQFVGSVSSQDKKPFLKNVFNNYLTKPEICYPVSEPAVYSQLQFYYPAPGLAPKSFAWLTSAGIYYGQLDSTISDDACVIESAQLLELPDPNSQPISFAITQFHALLLYSDHVTGISLLNGKLVFENYYNEAHGKLVSINKDPVTGTVWVVAAKAVFRYKIVKEDRNVWEIYLEKGQYELAKQYCKDNPIYLDQVLVKQAEKYFETEDYVNSALLYADTQSSFEEIALKFLQIWELNGLKLFLRKKLEKLNPKQPQDKTQITMISIWMFELFLNQSGNLRLDGKDNTVEYRELQEEFENFKRIPQVVECIRANFSTIEELIASHGDKENLIRLTIENKNFEKVIRQQIMKGNYEDALTTLMNQSNRDLFYPFMPVILEAIPRQAIQILIRESKNLDPVKLLPAFVASNIDENHAVEIMRYLETCCPFNQNQSLHNYLLSLYARYNETKLMKYIDIQGQEISMVNYDVRYALTLCQQHKLTKACVKLSALLGLWESAVDLALTVSIDLAKETAALPPHSSLELRKKLWLKIAEHIISKNNDIKEAMEFLKECDLIKIEDILPFFSDFDTIDHFRDAICDSLQKYNEHIKDIKEDIESATKSANIIRGEIASFRNRYTIIKVSDVCDLCNIQLMLRSFYTFPCGHRFHSACLTKELLPLLEPQKRFELQEKQKQFAVLTSSNRDDSISVNSTTLSPIDKVKSEIDSILAYECFFCGDLFINLIDKPFIEDDDFERVMKEWA